MTFSGSSTLIIPVALGAVAGLCLFFRGFWLLQHKPAARSAPRSRPAVATITTTFTTTGSDTRARTSPEVIRLSPANGESNGAVPVTQQGTIAAALLKAGVSTPMSWSTTGDDCDGPVRVAVPPPDSNRSASAVEALDFGTSKILNQVAGRPGLLISPDRPTGPGPSFGWKPALMIWGGPVLTLACVYILFAYFGWL